VTVMIVNPVRGGCLAPSLLCSPSTTTFCLSPIHSVNFFYIFSAHGCSIHVDIGWSLVAIIFIDYMSNTNRDNRLPTILVGQLSSNDIGWPLVAINFFDYLSNTNCDSRLRTIK
jgi:hypothetical protein